MAKKSVATIIRRARNLGDLQNLLLDCCPADKEGNVSIPLLAGHLKVTPWSLYKWIREGKVPPGRVKELVTFSTKAGKTKKIEDFHPFVF